MFRNPTTDLLIVLLIVLLIFGPKRLPTLGRQLGQSLREFKESITGESKGDDEADRPELTQASATPPAPAAQPTPTAAVPQRDSAETGPEHRS
jgi:sec-independent protein translocase protein TatA